MLPIPSRPSNHFIPPRQKKPQSIYNTAPILLDCKTLCPKRPLVVVLCPFSCSLSSCSWLWHTRATTTRSGPPKDSPIPVRLSTKPLSHRPPSMVLLHSATRWATTTAFRSRPVAKAVGKARHAPHHSANPRGTTPCRATRYR